ncbi:DNA polymerase I [Mycobacterium phage JAMaL]|uniref:DNA polymerase n=1 Tax=Mycobacterium phage JAMaL TaxID=1429905 RepID=V5UQA6_9CAUD|nr:DNA polymerase I [Mycobacterium phage JAMaL]AHB79373.1 DNA polymerase I [Mycobacterium phage JAMaL]
MKLTPADAAALGTTAIPRVPSRSWYDPVLDATMHTGQNARLACGEFIYGTEPGEHLVAMDIETPGLNSFTINCVTFAWEVPGTGQVHTVILDPARNGADHSIVRDMVEHARHLVFHNAPFDAPILHHAQLLDLPDVRKIVDTLVIARFAVPDVMVPKNLTALSVRHLGLDDDKGGLERAFKAAGYKTQQAGFEGMDIESPVYRYGAMADTVATLRIEPLMRAKALHWATDHPFQTYGATTEGEAEQLLWTQETVHRVMLRRSAAGLAVDRAYLDRYAEQVDIDRNLAIAELAAHGLEGGSGKGAKLVEYLHERGELPANWPRTPTRKLRATKADLDGLDHPLAAAQRKLATIEKVMGYLEKVDRQASVTGRCHPQVGVLGASATGRMAYGSPELQQFPADARAIISDDGQGLTSIDWSQIEPVTMALMAKDHAFLAPFEAGEDLYEPIQRSAGIDRPTAKVVLLGTMYGLGIAKLARQIGHTEESAAQIRRQMFEAMKGCERWMRKVQNVAETYGRVVTAGGRILPVDQGFEYKAVNYAIQGSAYDVLANSIVEMDRRGIGDHLQLAMHDELVVDTEVAEEVQQIMLTPPEFLITWAERVPVLRTDRADMGSAWAKV